jgi:hypothetical protein
MAPFAALFNKHVGNLSERYKLSEAARVKLFVSTAKFSKLLRKPKEWTSLSESDKLTYLRMHHWLPATDDEIEALKNRMRKDKAQQAEMTLEFNNNAQK